MVSNVYLSVSTVVLWTLQRSRRCHSPSRNLMMSGNVETVVSETLQRLIDVLAVRQTDFAMRRVAVMM